MAAVGLLAGSLSTAGAQGGTPQVLLAELSPLNGSGVTGYAVVVEMDNRVTVAVFADDTSANLPHAQHIHIGGRNECPTLAADSDGDGLVSTAEGQPSYGAVRVSLTTEGDVSADSGLAVDRFPVAWASGDLIYLRTFHLPSGVTMSDVQHGVVVVHGISDISGEPSMYDGSARSSLSPDLPLEATIPAACGKLTQHMMP